MLSLLIAQATPDAAPSGPLGLLSSPLPLIVLMFGIFYFMIIRPQSKQQKGHQSFLDKLQKGDEVVTNGGLIGKVAAISEDKVLTLEIAPKVNVRVLKTQISGPVLQPGADGKPAEDLAKK